ncbi:hypothetical protein BURMUCGD1_4130 [Burkholderia multivorans CGD1]|nr:hypothetical protein BURMUCGD1_4130 [Burkholderia multivorans CGD1]
MDTYTLDRNRSAYAYRLSPTAFRQRMRSCYRRDRHYDRLALPAL